MLNGYLIDENVYWTCLAQYNITREEERSSLWRCGIILDSIDERPQVCQSENWDLTQLNWEAADTDQQLQRALQGGVDSDGINWVGRRGNATFAETFGQQFWNENLHCSIANPCQHKVDCTSVGSFIANPRRPLSMPYQQAWVYYATSAFVNINQQLRNQYYALEAALDSLAFDTFSIDEFFPTKSQDFDLQNSLTGLSGIFSILGGFVPIPVVGEAIAAAGTIASGVGTFLENSAAASDDPLEAQKIFSQKVLKIYRVSLRAMDDLVTKLFIGDSIPDTGPGSFTLLDIMKGGAWVNPNTLTKVSNFNEKIRREVLARSINSLWKSRTADQTIKMWVLFTDLSEDPNSSECVESKSMHS
ncbi:hypothetical protein XPA_000916 [Xanthoria parietina]